MVLLVKRPSNDLLQPTETGERLDPRQILALLRRQFWLILLCVCISLALAGLWLLQVVPIYSASAQLLLVPRKERALATDAVIADLSSDASSIATELTLVRSYSVASRVVERLKLDEDPAFVGRPGGSFLIWLRSLIMEKAAAIGGASASRVDSALRSGEVKGENDGDLTALRGGVGEVGGGGSTEADVARASVASIQTQSEGAVHSDRGLGFSTLGVGGDSGGPAALPEVSPTMLAAASQVQAATAVTRFGATYFIMISYSHPDPKRAALLANAVAESYLMEQLEARYQAARRAAGWLSERLSALRIKLDKSEQELADFRATNNVFSAKSGSIADQQAAEINQQLVTARTQTIEKQTKYEQIQRIA